MGDDSVVLEGLDDVPWQSLHHAYGEATDVPGRLRALLAEDPEVRRAALYDLFGTIWHQGTVWEASACAVPYLLSMLRSPDVQDKAGIAGLVAELADGDSGYEGFTDPNNPLTHTMRRQLRQEGRDLDEELRKGRSYVCATREAIEQGVELLYPYLSCPYSDVRHAVARALAHYANRSAVTVPLLQAALQVEEDPEVREAIEAAIQRLSEVAL